MKFSIYRFDPDKDQKPYMQDIEVELLPTDKILPKPTLYLDLIPKDNTDARSAVCIFNRASNFRLANRCQIFLVST